MEETFRAFKQYLARVRDLNSAGAVLGWDRETNMPEGGAAARARQLGTLSEMTHELFVADEVGEWLEALRPYEESLDYGSDDASLIRFARREYEKERRVPSKLVGELARAASLAQQSWVKARQAADFSLFQPDLERLVEFTDRLGELL